MSEKKKLFSGQIAKIALVVVMVLGGLFLILNTYIGQSSFDNEYATNKKMIEQLRIDIDDINGQDIIGKEDTIDVLVSAKTAGEAVSSLQNEYVTIPTSTDSTNIQAHADKLSKYFDESAQVGRQPWYKNKGATWSFQSSYDFVGTTSNVLWLCHSESGELLAYATAVYDAKGDVFKNVVYKNTVTGNARVSATVENEAKYYDSMIKQIQDATGGDIIEENKFSEEDMQAIHDAREQLKKDQEHLNGGDE